MSSAEEDADISVQGVKRGVPVSQVTSDSSMSEDGNTRGLSPKRSAVVVRRQSVSKVTIEITPKMYLCFGGVDPGVCWRVRIQVMAAM